MTNFGLQLPHFASRNTQHLLKINSNSALFPQNPCTIQINVLPLQYENPPSLSTMLKCAGRFLFMAHLIPFNKQFSSSAELVTLLRSRGMYIEGVFESWMTVIAVTRNACGHHARVWNKRNAMQPAVPSNPAGRWITLPTDPMRTYFDLCVIKYFLNVISPSNDMLSKMQSLFAEYPEVDLRALGFPSGNWQDEPLWSTR